MNNNRRKSKKKPALRIIPLGGVGEVGKNMTAIEYGENILVVDCGLMFPSGDMPGIDYVIPETAYLKSNRDKIRAFVLTHGHEDHIGATPYILKDYSAPVYGTRLTLALVEMKLSEHGVKADLRSIKPGDKVKCGIFEVEFIKVSHSLEDTVALAITTPAGVVMARATVSSRLWLTLMNSTSKMPHFTLSPGLMLRKSAFTPCSESFISTRARVSRVPYTGAE